MTSNLEIKILGLISSQREGQYWDFKEKHHNNKAELLHDILCMANSLHKSHKYIIYGVSDPSKGCQITGVGDDPNRRNQNNLIDFIRFKDFAGDIKPEIELKTLAIGKKNVVV
jgi:hypothetical protein